MSENVKETVTVEEDRVIIDHSNTPIESGEEKHSPPDRQDRK